MKGDARAIPGARSHGEDDRPLMFRGRLQSGGCCVCTDKSGGQTRGAGRRLTLASMCVLVTVL